MPKIIGDTLADHRELTRRRLFDALGDLLAVQPFDAITMSQIAAHADVGRTAVYNHFADKESLLLAYMRTTTARFVELLGTALEGEDDPIEQLRIYLRAHLELKDRLHLASATPLRSQVSAENSPHLGDHAGIVEHVLFHILEAAMAQGRIPAGQNALALVASIHSCLAGQPMPEDPRMREDSIRTLQAFVLRGVGASAQEVPLPATSEDEAEGESPLPPRDARAFLRCPVVQR